MFLKPRKPSTDPRLRSLLQKAVRRGYQPIVEQVAKQLDAIGDSTWLRSRAAVITFEESWPLAGSISIDRRLSTRLDVLTRAATRGKQKDAAGLGALAHAYQEGDASVLDEVTDRRSLRIVAEALTRPIDFFQWALSVSRSEQSTAVILSAQKYLPAATWQWDKACILAGALLSVSADVPDLDLAQPSRSADSFPYWVALDKHTDEGKIALREVARDVGTTYSRLIWASFYLESAFVNELLPSPWFEAERSWRLKRAGLSLESANDLWSRARPLVQARLAIAASSLEALLISAQIVSDREDQTSLL